MSIVVTCASGRLGRRVAAALAGRGNLVLADAEPHRLGGSGRHADFDDPLTLPAAFAGATTVLFSGGWQGGPQAPRLAVAIEAARGAGVERIVLLSSIDPRLGNPAAWAEADRAAEAMVRSCGLGWTILRLQEALEDFVDIGERQRAGRRMFANRGTGRSAPVALDDAAAAIAAALTDAGQAGRILDITGPALVGTADLAAAFGLEAVTHKDAKFLDQLLADGTPAADARAQVALGRAVREGYYAVVSGDVQALTGKPPTALGEAIKASTP